MFVKFAYLSVQHMKLNLLSRNVVGIPYWDSNPLDLFIKVAFILYSKVCHFDVESNIFSSLKFTY